MSDPSAAGLSCNAGVMNAGKTLADFWQELQRDPTTYEVVERR